MSNAGSRLLRSRAALGAASVMAPLASYAEYDRRTRHPMRRMGEDGKEAGYDPSGSMVRLQNELIRRSWGRQRGYPQTMTLGDLAKYDGRDGRPRYFAAGGAVYDASSSDRFADSYSGWSGRDATVALAKMSLSPDDVNRTDWDRLTERERESLRSWTEYFDQKYIIRGRLAEWEQEGGDQGEPPKRIIDSAYPPVQSTVTHPRLPFLPVLGLAHTSRCEGEVSAEEEEQYPPGQIPLGARLARSKRAAVKRLFEKDKARNVMLHRMRSVRGRDLSEKYNVDWRNVLGEGAYGSVHPARHAATGQKVALKKMRKRYTDRSSFRIETDALLRIYDNGGHPNVAGLRDMYEDNSNFYMVMDLVSGGEMFEHLIDFGSYSESDAARLVQEVASALAFLHGVGVVHSDLKPENLLLCSKKKSNGTIKVIDFGCAVVNHDNYNDEEVGSNSASSAAKAGPLRGLTSSTGTTAYWSPERFARDSRGRRTVPDAAADMWSLGVILYIMLTGAHPFDATGRFTDEEIEERITADPAPPMDPEWVGHLSPAALDLIQKLMAPDPEARLTAREMLEHPWVTGDARKTKMADSAIKLARFKDLRTKMEAGIFAVLVKAGNKGSTMSEAKVNSSETGKMGGAADVSAGDAPADIMKRAFEVFDNEGKGYVSSGDLGRVVAAATGKPLSSNEQKDMLAAAASVSQSSAPKDDVGDGLSLSGFTALFGRLKQRHFPRGHYIFRAGDPGDSMYFINSGRVEIQTRKGQLVAILRNSDFFGEGSLMDDKNIRFTSAKASTPVDVIKISKADFNRYIANSSEAKHEIKRKWKARLLTYAKNLIRLQTNVKERIFKRGDIIYEEGDVGQSMFMVEEGRLEVKHGGVAIHEYTTGESFGESSLIFKKPRSSTVVCTSDSCKLLEMPGQDFLDVLKASPETATSLRDMCRKRLFKWAVKAFSLHRKRGLTNDDIVEAFHEADTDGSGTLSFEEIKRLMHSVDPTIPEREIMALLVFVDVDEDGCIGLEEFKRLFRSFEHEELAKKF